jgi:hypothetical protein
MKAGRYEKRVPRTSSWLLARWIPVRPLFGIHEPCSQKRAGQRRVGQARHVERKVSAPAAVRSLAAIEMSRA